MIRINKNESPIPALDDATLKNIIANSNFNFYPDEEYDAFIKSYADYYQLSPNQVSAANGSDEWIQKCMIALPDGPVLTLNPDFFMYTAYAHQINRPIHYVDAEDDYTFSLDKIKQSIQKLKPAFFIMSVPHNPSGIQYPKAFLEEILGIISWKNSLTETIKPVAVVKHANATIIPIKYLPNSPNANCAAVVKRYVPIF